jgi:hypothetical protein
MRTRHVQQHRPGRGLYSDETRVLTRVVELLGRQLRVGRRLDRDDLASGELVPSGLRARFHLLLERVQLLQQSGAVRLGIGGRDLRWRASASRSFVRVDRGNTPSKERQPFVSHRLAPGR